MRSLSEDLAAHLAGEVTTLCRCWRVTRADGAVFGFTDHDRTLKFAEIDFTPVNGVVATDMVAGEGLAVGGHEVAGALALDGLSASDLAAGLWDNARVVAWLVNWQSVDQRVVIARGNIGEVTREDDAFHAEVRSPGHQLDQPRGRVFSRRCDADLGDERCGKVIAGSAFSASGVVAGTDWYRRVTANGLGPYVDGWFTHGLLTWTSGANQGATAEIRAHTRGAEVTLSFWQATAARILVGDTFTIVAGCDKRFSTCVEKFSNATRFRGFPHMPGNDFVLSYPTSGEDNEGSARE